MEALGTYADRCFVDYSCHLLSTCEEGICVHKAVWPITLLDGALWLCICAISALANAVGASERVVLVPVIIWMGGFSTHQALPIVSLATVGGLSVALAYQRLTLGLSADYRLALILIVPLLLGTSIGVTVNAVLPEWLLLGLLLVSLLFETVRIFAQ
jgi:uncharacterized membrane protein YfcA